MSEWRAALHRHFRRALRAGFPVLGTSEHRSTLFNSTPYVVAYAEFVQRAATWPGRADLVGALQECYSHAQAAGVVVDAMLIGGSFLDLEGEPPRDIDGVWLYRSAHGRGNDVEHLVALQKRFKAHSVDVRFVPLDSDPILLLKAVSFFSILYTKRKGEMAHSRGLLLVDCVGAR